MADGRLGEAFIDFSFGRNVFARCSSGASGGGHHADGVQAFYCEHLGLCFEQDVADLPAEVLVASLGVATGFLARFGDGVSPALAGFGLAGDVVQGHSTRVRCSPDRGLWARYPELTARCCLAQRSAP